MPKFSHPYLLVLLFLPRILGAQQASPAEEPAANTNNNPPQLQAETLDLLRSFGTLSLANTLEATKEALKEDPNFIFSDWPEVFLPGKKTLLEVPGSGFIRNASLQFYEDKLFIIILNLDPRYLDYYTMFSSLREKYGEPNSIDPKNIIWATDLTRLSLEFPLTVKIIDQAVWEQISEGEEERVELYSRQRAEFLEQF